MTTQMEPHRVLAYNTSKFSENKIHDDTVARKFGFSGGLVPGVDVLAYMLHMPVAKWGRAFLERGVLEARFVKPVYDGEFADVTATDNGGGIAIEVVKWLGTVPRNWADGAASEYLADIRETEALYADEGLAHPGTFQKVMNKL